MSCLLHEDELVASLSRESFYDFVCEFWEVIIHEKLIDNWHIKYLCDELQEVAERVMAGWPNEYDLIINVPPGTSKSTICSQMLPAWVWTRMGHARFICGSYAKEVALKDSIRTRDIVTSDKYIRCFPDLFLRMDENAKGYFVNNQMGYRLSVGIGGYVTGFHGHFLIIDDPLNPEESFSKQELKNANRWMEHTLPSRKVDKEVTPIILIQQRLHENDPSGMLLEKYKDGGVKHICLPGQLVEDDYGEFGVKPPGLEKHYVDGLFDPKRLPEKVLKKMEKDLGAYGFASQVLQRPIPLGGGMFKVEKFVLADAAPKRLKRVIRSWDKAGTEQGGKYSAGVKMAVDEHGFYWVLDVVRGQWGATRREQTIKQTAELDGHDIRIIFEIEGGSGGKESGENTVRNLAGFTAEGYHPTGSKEARAYAFASQVGAGNVFVLNAPWTKDYIEEFRWFQENARYSDQVDASSGAFNRIARKKKRVGALFSSR